MPAFLFGPRFLRGLVVLSCCVLTAPDARPAPVQGVDYDVVPVGRADGTPTALAFAPGVPDRVYVAARDGRILIVEDGAVRPTPLLDLSSRLGPIVGENGLIGLVFDPDYASSRFVYVAYTNGAGQGDSVVSRFTVPAGQDDVADPASEEILVGPLLQASVSHKAGDLEFGPDGMLYHALGDGGTGFTSGPEAAQDLTRLQGKILRLDPDLPAPHAPPDNPFVGVSGVDPRIYAYGLRNPFRFDVDSATGDVILGDVGQNDWEEIDVIPAADPGRNFGWPCTEGDACSFGNGCVCGDPGLTPPALALGHGVGGFCSITGGVLVRGAGIPSLEGRFLCADFCSGSFLSVDVATSPADVDDLSDVIRDVTGPIGVVTDFAQHPATGDIWFVQLGGARLWRITKKTGFARYCESTPNSTGTRSRIHAGGVPSLTNGDVTFEVDGLPPFQTGVFLASDRRFHFAGLGGGEGNLCVAPPVLRWGPTLYTADANGRVTRRSDLTDLVWGLVATAGATWHFQYWTRDPSPATTSNLSDGVSITFAP